MKKLVVLIAIMIFIGVSYSTLSQSVPSRRYKVDLKTKFKSKKDLNPLKKGLKEQIEASPYFENKEFGEDFSLWILAPDVTREILPDGSKKITYSCTIEIRTPAAFGKGDFIGSRQVNLEYIIDEKDLARREDPQGFSIGQFIFNTIENTSKKIGDASNTEIGKAFTATSPQGQMVSIGVTAINEGCALLKKHFSPKDNLDYKAEFYIVGRYVYKEFEELVIELEAKAR